MSRRFPVPSASRLMLELLRAGVDVSLLPAALPALRKVPRGDGHPVMVLPGFGGGDASTAFLRTALRRLGYDAHGWGLGRNLGPGDEVFTGLAGRLAELAEGGKVSLVGWSLGGSYAHRLARATPDQVRCIVTMGSPLRARPSNVPATSIFSHGDGVVPSVLSQVEPRSNRENVQVRGSHVALGFNPAVLLVVADRLAQPESSWAPFDRSRYPGWFPRR